MSKKEPTPGPWKWYWKQINDESDCGVFWEKEEGQVWSVCRAPRYQTKEQWEADATLICASRDLLEACKAVLKWMDSGQNTAGIEWNEYFLVRKAICKAEGFE